jgi:hypothetical protein
VQRFGWVPVTVSIRAEDDHNERISTDHVLITVELHEANNPKKGLMQVGYAIFGNLDGMLSACDVF